MAPKPKWSFLNAYYSKTFSYTDGQLNEKIIRNRARTIKRKIISLKETNISICDVGSGYGFFLDEIQRSFQNVSGIEPSKKLAQFSRKKFNINTYNCSLENFIKNNPHTTFDVVTCIHVIEHVLNPKKFMLQLLKLVKPGGLLFIETPNANSHLLYSEKDTYTFLIAPEHIWIFSFSSFDHLLEPNTTIIHRSTYSYPEHVMGIIKSKLKEKQRRDARTYYYAGKKDTQTRINYLNNWMKVKRHISFFVFDILLARIITPFLNLHHKGSILELYIQKKQ